MMLRMGLSETSNTKSMVSATNPKKTVRSGSAKPDRNGGTIPFSKSRSSGDKSLNPTDSKLASSTKTSSPTEKQVRVPKVPSDSQSPLDFAFAEIRKLREQLEVVKDEKAKALEELRCTNNLVDETNEKLAKALITQKKTQESFDIEKCRSVELEQERIESTIEIERIHTKHAAEIANLISKCAELQNVSNAALSQADDAIRIKDVELAALLEKFTCLKFSFDLEMKRVSDENKEVVKQLRLDAENLKIQLDLAKESESKVVEMEGVIKEIRMEIELSKKSELNAKKMVRKYTEMVDQLSLEVDGLKHKLEQAKVEEVKLMEMESLIVRLRGDLMSTRKSESDARKLANENSDMAKRLSSEIDYLKKELEHVKLAETNVVEMENLAKGLPIELTVKELELNNSHKILDEWKTKVELLEIRLEEATLSEQSAQESLATAIRQVVETNVMLQEAESEIRGLKDKLDSLDSEMTRQKNELEDSNWELNRAREEASEKGRTLEVLKSNIRVLEESKKQLLEHEKDLSASIEKLTNEKEKMLKKLEISADQNEKCCVAMDGLALEVREASTEVRDMQERLLEKHDELEDARAHIRRLELDLQNTEENYHVLLDEAKYEIVCLRRAVERSETTQLRKPETSAAKENCQATSSLDSPVSSHVGDEKNQKDENLDGDRNEEPIEIEIKMWKDHKMIESSSEIERVETDSTEEEFYAKVGDKGSFDPSNEVVVVPENSENVPSSPNMQLQQLKKKSLLLNKFGNFMMRKSSLK